MGLLACLSMALAHEQLHRTGRDSRSRSDTGSHRGRNPLAEVIPIRPGILHRKPGILGSLITVARGLSPSRAQAASVGSTPRPPSSPAFLPFGPILSPDDVA
jgi:hypothetical protein